MSTSLLWEDDKYLYLIAETPGFSSFAITGNSIATVNGIQPANLRLKTASKRS